MNKICAQEGTRLASFKTVEERDAILEWAFSPEQTADANVSN